MAFPQEGDGSLNSVFKALPLSAFDHPTSQSVLTINSNTTVTEALKILAERNFLCAPVRDVKQPEDSSWVSKYIGMVDFLGMVDWMVKKCGGKQPSTFAEFCALEQTFASTTVEALTECNRWTPFVPLDYQLDSTLDAMLLLGKYGVHRVCTVKSPEGTLVSIITQSAIVKLLHDNLPAFAAVTSKSIKELGLAKHMTIGSVSVHQTYWDAFKLMSDKLYSAVPVLKEGKLVGNVSVKDLRVMFGSAGSFSKLNMQLSASPDFIPLAYTCREDDTLESVLHKLQHTRIHRVYLVDAQDHVLSVVSLRDIIARLVKEPAESKLWEYFAA